MTYQHMIVEHVGATDWVTLNRPEQLNALTVESLAELNHYFDSLLRNYAVRVVVLKGAGRAFCAGLDIKAARARHDSEAGDGSDGSDGSGAGAVRRTPEQGLQSQREFSGLVMRMRRCPQPIIGLIHGHAAGGGMAIALGCDIRIAAEGAKMNCAFIKIGLSGCEMGVSYHLPRLVGTAVAAELMYTGRFIEAQRAMRVGLVSDVVPASQLAAAGKAMAEDMLATAPLGLRLTKECFWAAVDGNDLASVIAMEDRNQVLTVANGDLAEGMAAFVEKRAPKYGG